MSRPAHQSWRVCCLIHHTASIVEKAALTYAFKLSTRGIITRFTLIYDGLVVGRESEFKTERCINVCEEMYWRQIEKIFSSAAVNTVSFSDLAHLVGTVSVSTRCELRNVCLARGLPVDSTAYVLRFYSLTPNTRRAFIAHFLVLLRQGFDKEFINRL